MKYSIINMMIFILFGINIQAQERVITFKYIGQKEIIKPSQQVIFAYDGVEEEDTYLETNLSISGEFVLTLKEKPISKITEKLMKDLIKTGSIIISCGDEPPAFDSKAIISANREIVFNTFADTAHVLPCQKVNIKYGANINTDSVYIFYQSDDWGYTLKLAKKDNFLSIQFSKLCQIFYLANPNLATVVVPENLRWEQVIWTPLANGYWELRLGNVNRGCVSRGLENIDQIRRKQPDYDKNIKTEKGNYRR